MLCKNCGNELIPGELVCSKCGKQIDTEVSQDQYFSKDKTSAKVGKIMKRKPYVIFTICFIILLFITNAMALTAIKMEYYYDCNGLGLALLYSIRALPLLLTILFAYCCMTKRLRDAGKNTYFAWFIAIPFFGLFYAIYLCFPKSKQQ